MTPREVRRVQFSLSQGFRKGCRLTLKVLSESGASSPLATTTLAQSLMADRPISWGTDRSVPFVFAEHFPSLELRLWQAEPQKRRVAPRLETKLFPDVPEIVLLPESGGAREWSANEALRLSWRTRVPPEDFVIALSPDSPVFARDLRLPPLAMPAMALESHETPAGQVYSVDVLRFLRVGQDAWRALVEQIAARHPSLIGFWIRVRVTATHGDGHWVQARSRALRVLVRFPR